MKHYISPTGELYAYELDGSQDDLIPADFVFATDEQVQAIQNPAPTAEQVIKGQIATLETSVTPRRMREAVLGTDAGWLADVDVQIAALRAQLQ
jgi:hypothetical protein